MNQAIITLIFGFAQWVLLHRRYPNTHKSILASAIASAVASATSATICFVLCSPITQATGSAVLSTVLTYAVGWLGYSLVTGIPLQYLLTQSSSTASNHR
jgi:hypothetical protein